MRRHTSRWVVAAIGVACAASGGCRRMSAHESFSPSGKPPFEVYVPGAWKSYKKEVFAPPAAAVRPWRVLMLQEQPRPKKNPQWKTIAASESGFLDMPEGSGFSCLYNPATFRPWANEHLTGIEKWDVLRSVRCSSDGWHTFSQAVHSITVSADGQAIAKSSEQAELYLSETVSSKLLATTILLRAD
jgi:hypothetical protein